RLTPPGQPWLPCRPRASPYYRARRGAHPLGRWVSLALPDVVMDLVGPKLRGKIIELAVAPRVGVHKLRLVHNPVLDRHLFTGEQFPDHAVARAYHVAIRKSDHTRANLLIATVSMFARNSVVTPRSSSVSS